MNKNTAGVYDPRGSLNKRKRAVIDRAYRRMIPRIITAMDSKNITELADELQRRAEEKFGRDRAEALRNDLLQMARELDSLNTYSVRYEDEP